MSVGYAIPVGALSLAVGESHWEGLCGTFCLGIGESSEGKTLIRQGKNVNMRITRGWGRNDEGRNQSGRELNGHPLEKACGWWFGSSLCLWAPFQTSWDLLVWKQHCSWRRQHILSLARRTQI